MTLTEVAPTNRRAGGLDACLVAVVVSVGVLLVAVADDLAAGRGFRVHGWLLTQINFSYEHEFIRRGLVGEVLRRVGLPPHEPLSMFFVALGIYAAFAALTSRLVWTALAASLDRRARLVGLAIALALPFTLPHFAYDLGRYDPLLYLMAVPLLISKRRLPLVAYVLVGLLATLVHEVFLLVQLPLVVSCLWHGRDRDPAAGRRVDPRIIAIVVGGLISGIAVFVAGDLESVPEPWYVLEVQSRIPDMGPAYTVLYDDLGTQVGQNLDRYSPEKILAIGSALVPALFLLLAARGVCSDPRIVRRIALVVAPSASLFVLGADVFRWVALASFSALVIVLLDLRQDPPGPVRLRAAKVPLALLAATAVLGPMGVIGNSYPIWSAVLDQL